MLEKKNLQKGNMLSRLSAVYRLFMCLFAGILFYFILPMNKVNEFTRLLAAWNIFSVCMLAISWITIFTTPLDEMRNEATLQDESRTIIFTIVIISTSASLLAVLILLVGEHGTKMNREINLFMAIGSMLLSWFLVHTIFTLRYAHLFYGNSESDSSVHAGGIIFPGEQKPDYLDFAYFSFVLGMTFQVSDVNVTSREFRRLALFHGILSFGYNTIIVALTINIIAGLNK